VLFDTPTVGALHVGDYSGARLSRLGCRAAFWSASHWVARRYNPWHAIYPDTDSLLSY